MVMGVRNFKDQKIVVTGGAGFIGSHIVEELLKRGVKRVTILDNLSTGFIDNIKPFLELDNVEFIKGDICCYETCFNAVVGADSVCHQAALGSVPRSIKDPLRSHHNNVTGFINILHASKEANVKRFIFASSSSVYGDDSSLVKTEDVVGKILSPYALTKSIDEQYATLYTQLYDMECVGFRYFNVFGPRQNPNGSYAAVIPKFIDQLSKDERATINGDGTISRDFTYVDNVVYGNLLALSLDSLGDHEAFGQVFNLGCGQSTSITELYNCIRDLLNSPLEAIYGPSRKGDILYSKSSTDKAFKLLDYTVKVPFKEGIKLTIQHYQTVHQQSE